MQNQTTKSLTPNPQVKTRKANKTKQNCNNAKFLLVKVTTLFFKLINKNRLRWIKLQFHNKYK